MTTTAQIKVPIVIAGELEVNIADLPPNALDLIKAALTLPNEDREIAAREHVNGWWSLPETITLYDVQHRRGGDEVLVMPRGFFGQLVTGLQTQFGADVIFEDRRVAPVATDGYFRPFLLRDYQADAVKSMLRMQQGFFKCPPGGGKTVTMLGLAAIAGLRTLVIVDKADLVEQWREEAHDFLGLGIDDDGDFSPVTGKIGQGVWLERDLTIALRQTLWEREWELTPMKWWETWGLTIYDEGHHLSADTLGALCRKCVSQLALGCSATPAKSETKGKIVSALVGPIVHEVPRQLLREKGILILPSVEQIQTDFEHEFWPTHEADAEGNCQMPKCKKTAPGHQHRNNFNTVQKHLTESDERNDLIAAEVMKEPTRRHLIPSRQLKHLDAIKKALERAGWEGPVFYLRGEENAKKESRGIVEQIKQSGDGCVVLSTVADEALNIPPLDRLHIVFPMRMEANVEQLVGRVERATPGKDGAVVKDYIDPAVEPLESQARIRLGVYRRQAYPVKAAGAVDPADELPIRFSSGDFSSFSQRWPVTIAHPLEPERDITVQDREHLFQASKTQDIGQFNYVLDAPTAAEAKERGQQVTLRSDWEDVKFDVMTEIIHIQCSQHQDLVDMLQATGNREIIEDRPDPEWGVGRDGNGKNLLGKAWMRVREEQRAR